MFLYNTSMNTSNNWTVYQLQNISDPNIRHNTALDIIDQQCFNSFFELIEFCRLGQLTEQELINYLQSIHLYDACNYSLDILFFRYK